MAADRIFKPKRRSLEISDRIHIAERLQFLALDEIAKIEQEGVGTVFHGGTSLSLLHGSPRWSEDLDFMSTPKAVAEVFSRRKEIERSIRMRMSLEMPGATIDLRERGSGDEAGHGNVERLMLRWEHPDRVGAVRIKVEFYTCLQESLEAYQSELLAPRRSGQTGQPIRGATLNSIRADKIVAIAQRPMIKHRDIHDLGYIAPLPQDGDIETHLRASMGIYGRTPEEIRDGLHRDVLIGMDTDKTAFIKDMERWFEPQVFLDMSDSGRFEELFDGFRHELRMGRKALDKMTSDCCPGW